MYYCVSCLKNHRENSKIGENHKGYKRTLTDFQKEILHALRIIPHHDRDLRSITIYFNPNYINGSDKEYSKIIKKELIELEKLEVVKKEIKEIQIYDINHRPKKFLLWDLHPHRTSKNL